MKPQREIHYGVLEDALRLPAQYDLMRDMIVRIGKAFEWGLHWLGY